MVRPDLRFEEPLDKRAAIAGIGIVTPNSFIGVA
jgi:hypothetical protein